MSSSSPAADDDPPLLVAVFGASQPNDDVYQASVRAGAAIARAGFGMINGGYHGTMEGSAEGHKEEAERGASAAARGGAAASPALPRVGVTVPSLFPYRYAGANVHVSSVHAAPTLLTRIDAMLCPQRRVVAVLVLPGTLGTLTELCCAWNLAALRGAVGDHAAHPRLRVFAYEVPWRSVIEHCAAALQLKDDVVARIEYVADADAAMALLAADAGPPRCSAKKAAETEEDE